jgi:hypothetical protein
LILQGRAWRPIADTRLTFISSDHAPWHGLGKFLRVIPCVLREISRLASSHRHYVERFDRRDGISILTKHVGRNGCRQYPRPVLFKIPGPNWKLF